MFFIEFDENLVQGRDQDQTIDLSAALEFLKLWLTSHALTVDAKLPRFLNNMP